ncbi:MAG: hypothetical protein HPY69_02135 [Armatimonadetes bacterium]|nr:hypothetical protein [Armatimonadota bacterium]
MLDSPIGGWALIIFACGGFVLAFGRRLAHLVEWPPWGMWAVGLTTLAWALGVAWHAIGPGTVVKVGIAGAFALAGYAWFGDRAEGHSHGPTAPRRQELLK